MDVQCKGSAVVQLRKGVLKDNTYQPIPLLYVASPGHTQGSGSEDPLVQSQLTVILRPTASGGGEEDCTCT